MGPPRTPDALEIARNRLGRGELPLTQLSDAVDALLNATVHDNDPPHNEFALVALGGYGRRELCPGSDVDIQFLVSSSPKRFGPFVEACLHAWWNEGLRLGYATRTITETVSLARRDLKTATTLLDARVLAGSTDLLAKLGQSLDKKVYRPGRKRLIEDILDERAQRHHRFGDTVYLLEPDIKLGEGGLRDLQGACWAAQILGERKDLSQCGLTAAECEDTLRAYDTLQQYRNVLHELAGRKADRIRFTFQESLAEILGSKDVVTCLQTYWQAAARVRESSRRILDVLQIRAGRPQRASLAIALDGSDAAQKLMSAFRQSSEKDLPLSPDTLVAAAEAIPLVDQKVRKDAAVAADFFHVLTHPDDRGLPLTRMHDIGLLTAYVPEFACLTGLYQRNVFHVYTVDVHTLHGIAMLKSLAAQSDVVKASPALVEAMLQLDSDERRVLFLSLLLHDTGKGGADADVPHKVAIRLGLSERQADQVALLVREHLLMALLAQTRDIHDPATLRHLAREVGDRQTLSLLYLLTWGDMSSANPDLLTHWKASLLDELYKRTDSLLSGGLGLYADGTHVVHKRRTQVLERLLGEVPEHPTKQTRDVDMFFGQLATRYFFVTDADDIVIHMDMVPNLIQERVAVRLDAVEDIARITVATWDTPGILARLSGTLAAHGVNIIGAEVHSRTDGIVIDVFLVEEPVNWGTLERDLRRVVLGEEEPEALLRKRERPSGLGERPALPVKTIIGVDLAASENYTVIDVTARDRPGLLYRVARALHRLGIDIHLARVSTEGHTASDAFYVQWISGGKVAGKERLDRVLTAVREAVDHEL